MTTIHRDNQTDPRRVPGMRRTHKFALLMVALIGGFYLLREHWSHLAGSWVYLLLLACPLMHLFHGHGGHGGHGGRGDDPSAHRARDDKEG